MLQDKALDLSHNGQPLKIQAMTGFVSQVQFADGSVLGTPSARQSLEDPMLQKALPPSNEEQRLTRHHYRKSGLEGLIAELKRNSSDPVPAIRFACGLDGPVTLTTGTLVTPCSFRSRECERAGE